MWRIRCWGGWFWLRWGWVGWESLMIAWMTEHHVTLAEANMVAEGWAILTVHLGRDVCDLEFMS